MSKFKVGDNVKINKKIISFKYGKGGVTSDVIGKIIGVREDNEYYVDFPSVRCWHGLEKELELVGETYTYEDLKKSPIGTKVTFESGIILIKVDKENYKEIKEHGTTRYIELLKGLKDNWQFMNQGKIIKIEEPTYKTVYEVKPEILDNTEKRYLKDVIRPFRDRVKYIEKRNISRGDYIRIMIQDTNICDLPYFEKDTMYKGMKLYRHYTLKELGI